MDWSCWDHGSQAGAETYLGRSWVLAKASGRALQTLAFTHRDEVQEQKLELVMAVRTQVLSDGSARPTEPKQIRGG